MKKVLPYLFLLIPIVLKAQLIKKDGLTLSECIAIGLKNNPDVRESKLRAEAGKIMVSQSKTNLLPNINAGYNTGINQGRSIDPFTNTYINQQYQFATPSLVGGMTIFNGFALLNTIRREAFNYEADKLAVQQVKDELTLRIILAYLEVLTNNELLELAYTQTASSKKQVDRLAILNEQEAVAPGEYFDLKGIYSNDQLSIINAANNVETAKLALVRLLNIPYDKAMQIAPIAKEDILLTDSVVPEEVYNRAIENLAMVKVNDMREKASDMDVRVQRSGYYPSVFLNAGVYSNYSGAADLKYKQQIDNNLNTTVNVGISIPLFNSFRTRNAVRLSKLDQSNAELKAATSRIQLRQLTDEACFNLQFAKEKYAVSIQQVNDFSESFKRAEIKYNMGAGTVVDYIVAKNNIDKSNINLINARYNYVFRVKILDYFQGKLNL